MHYTLRQLQVFLAVAQFQNVTKAAEYLSMSQSACSGALKELEQQYDIQLFDRIGKRLQTNEQGNLLRPKAQALLESAQELEQHLSGHKEVGHLKLGATLTIGNYLAVGLITQFMQSFPGAGASLNVANTQTVVQSLLNFDIDVGLIEGEFHHPDLEIFYWREDELTCFCSTKHPFATIGELSDQDLLDAQWILREQGSGTRQAFDRAMHGLTPMFKVLLELQHTEAIKRAVETELGISCLSKISLQDAFLRGTLCPLRVPHRNFKRNFYIALHKDKYRSAGIDNWLRICGIEPTFYP